MAAFQKFAMTIPARMAGDMSGYADAITIRTAQKAIRKELETMLTAYVDAMKRTVQYKLGCTEKILNTDFYRLAFGD